LQNRAHALFSIPEPFRQARKIIIQITIPGTLAKGVSEKSFSGGTGDPPDGNPPDGRERTGRTNGNALFARRPFAIPVGGSPTGAGGSPAPPIYQTRSNPDISHPFSAAVLASRRSAGFQPAVSPISNRQGVENQPRLPF
jgi:hypothetical protein